MNSNRREFLRQITLFSGSILLIPSCSGFESPWRFLTSDEAKTVIAFAEQIIPADKDPGATDAGVVNFIDKQLVRHYIRFQEDYRNGILAIEKCATSLHKKPFYELDWETQTQFLEKMEAGELPSEVWEKNNQKQFFRMLLDHSMQGFYGSPRHGGNKNYVSYKMMKIDYPHVIGQNRYDEKRKTTKTHVI